MAENPFRFSRNSMMILLTLYLTSLCVIASSDQSCIYAASKLDYFDYTKLVNERKQTNEDHTARIRTTDGGFYLVKFNLCRNVKSTCPSVKSMAVMTGEDNPEGSSECIVLQSGEIDRSKQTYVPWNKESLEESHLFIHFKSSQQCENTLSEQSTGFYGLDVEVFCDKSMAITDPAVVINNGEPNLDPCHPKVQMRSLAGCKIYRTEAISVFFDNYYWAFAIIFITFGLYNILFGGKMFRLTILLFGILSTVGGVFFLLFFILEIHGMSQSIIFLCLLSSASVGGVIGYFMTRIIQVGVCVIGCWTGLVIAILLDSLIFYRLHMSFILYFLIAILVGLCGWLAFKYYEYVLIFSSSILGSYFFVRGISLIVGGYPTEVDVLEQLKHGTFIEIPWTFYLYLLFMIAFGFIGVIIQVKRLTKTEQKPKKKGKRKIKIKKKSEVGAAEGQKEKSYVDMEEEAD